ncbi:hypothetical protein BPIT_01910 [Candidatus Brocadia pituitae]|nr:hypothetical protein BPIT_01910 [Candidatus Brocadia pituitae]
MKIQKTIKMNRNVVAIHELPLQNCNTLDDTIFDIINITEVKRNDDCWAVCALVKNWLDKARSV